MSSRYLISLYIKIRTRKPRRLSKSQSRYLNYQLPLSVYAVSISTNSFAIAIVLQSLWVRVLWNRLPSFSSVPLCLWHSSQFSPVFGLFHQILSCCECACLLVRVLSSQVIEKPCAVLNTHRVKFCRTQNYRYPCNCRYLCKYSLPPVLPTS